MRSLAGVVVFAGIAAGVMAEDVWREVPLAANYDVVWQVKPRHDYSKTLVGKLFLSHALYDGMFKRRDNGRQKVYLTCEQALAAIRGMDAITLGMPKIMYLVGWQYDGHDSKYPAFFEGNPAVKRAGDADPLESVRWVMREGRKCHTAVSVHINLSDAYPDSPLFPKYLAADVIGKDTNGVPYEAEWGYKISYAREWQTGLAQERLDKLLSVLPIAEAGTIHVDCFHSRAPIGYKDKDGKRRVRFQDQISPGHGISQAEEVAAQKKIISYLDGKGVDVTEEGNTEFTGYVPFLYHYSENFFFKYPRHKLYGAHVYGGHWGALYGENVMVEPIFMKGVTSETFKVFTREFCRTTLIGNFLNHFAPEKVYESDTRRKIVFSEGVVSERTRDGKVFTVRQQDRLFVENGDVFIPALWTPVRDLVAFSEKGYGARTWELPRDFPAAGRVSLCVVDETGEKPLGTRDYAEGRLTLALKPGEMLHITLEAP